MTPTQAADELSEQKENLRPLHQVVAWLLVAVKTLNGQASAVVFPPDGLLDLMMTRIGWHFPSEKRSY